MQTKTCGWCRKAKPVTEFYKHKTNRDGIQGHCKLCHNARMLQKYRDNKPERIASCNRWRKANPDRVSLHQAKSRIKNRESRNAYSSEWRKKNSEIQKSLNKEWYERNSEKARANARADYHANRESRLIGMKEWKKNNKGKTKGYAAERRLREIAGGGSFSDAEWYDLVERCGNRCLKCGRSDVDLSADHVIPVVRGGPSFIWNIQPLCLPCNQSKGAKYTDYRLTDDERHYMITYINESGRDVFLQDGIK